MTPHLCIFEDAGCSRLLPLVFFRPTCNLRCGISSLKEKILRAYPGATLTLHCRDYLAAYMRERNPGVQVNQISTSHCLFMNGRVMAGPSLAERIPPAADRDTVYVKEDQLVAAFVSGQNLERLKTKLQGLLSLADFQGIPRQEVDVPLIVYPWHLVQRNGEELRRDFEALVGARGPDRIRGRVHDGVHLLKPDDIFIDEGTTVKPGTVIDAEDGPIYIGKNVRIFAQATLIGPVCVGDRSWIKVGAEIYENTSIGPVCKVGGEVEESIIHGYSNKQHGGFLGHAYLGTWVNLGADTNNSDLKNTYGSVKVMVNGESVDSGSQFVGLTMGDHSKSAINSMFNTGTVVGLACNIFGFGFPPKYVPSFSWGAAGETFTTFNIDRAIEVARRVMARRKIQLTPTEDLLFRKVFELTSVERRQHGMPF
ncbi:MAG: GlmU family protein [Planctomycetes bacterium]|nr:GlmU family protein [Planctomycetota bacterium]